MCIKTLQIHCQITLSSLWSAPEPQKLYILVFEAEKDFSWDFARTRPAITQTN